MACKVKPVAGTKVSQLAVTVTVPAGKGVGITKEAPSCEVGFKIVTPWVVVVQLINLRAVGVSPAFSKTVCPAAAVLGVTEAFAPPPDIVIFRVGMAASAKVTVKSLTKFVP